MKILHTLDLYHPSVGGTQKVVKELSERLVQLGHNVTVATTKHPKRKKKIINGVKIKEFNIKGNLISGIEGETKKFSEFLIKSDFDIIFNYAAQQWSSDITFQNLKKIKAKKVIAPCGFSALNKIYSIDYFSKMPHWLSQYDAVVFTSKYYQDYQFAQKHKVKNCHIIPNAASQEEFKKVPKKFIRKKFDLKKNNFLIVLIGTHTGNKGHLEAIKIFKKANIPNSTLLIIANSMGEGCQKECLSSMNNFNNDDNSKQCNQKIIIKSLKRNETIAALFEANLFLFPSKIECAPLVIYESMAAGTPFLVTNVGNTKEIVRSTKAGEIMPTIRKGNQAFPIIWLSAIKLRKIVNNKSKLKQMSKKGRKFWRQQFTWQKATQKYEHLYNSLLKYEE